MSEQTREQKERDEKIQKVTEKLSNTNDSLLLQTIEQTKTLLKADDEREQNRIATGDLTDKEIKRLYKLLTQKTVHGQVITDDMRKAIQRQILVAERQGNSVLEKLEAQGEEFKKNARAAEDKRLADGNYRKNEIKMFQDIKDGVMSVPPEQKAAALQNLKNYEENQKKTGVFEKIARRTSESLDSFAAPKDETAEQKEARLLEQKGFTQLKDGIVKLGKGFDGFFKSFKDKAKEGGLKALKGFAIGLALIGFLKFLQSPLFDKLLDGIKSLFGFIDDMVEFIGPTGSIILGIGAIIALLSPFKTLGLLTSVIGSFVGLFTKGGSVTEGISKSSKSLGKRGLFSGLKNATSKFTGLFSKGGLLSKGISGVTNMFSKLPFGGGGKLTGALSTGISKFTGLFAKGGGLLSGLGGIAGSVARFAGPVGVAITAAKGIFDGASAGIEEYKKSGDLGKAVKEGFAGAASGLTFGLISQETISDGLTSIGDAASSVVDGITGIFKSSEQKEADRLREKQSYIDAEMKKYENATFEERQILDEIAELESDGKHKTHLAYMASLQVQQDDELAQLERQKSEKKSFFESMSNKLSELTGIELPDFADVKETFSSIGDEFKRRGDALKVSLSEAKDSIVDGLENIGDKFTDLTGIEIPTMQGMKDKLTDTKNSVLNFLGLKSEEDIAKEKRDRAVASGIGGPDDIGVAEQTQERLLEEKETNTKELQVEKNKLITLTKERNNLQTSYIKLSRARDMARATGESQFTSGFEATMANTDMSMSPAERKFHSSFITTRNEDEITEEMKKIEKQYMVTTALRNKQRQEVFKTSRDFRKIDLLKTSEIANIENQKLTSSEIQFADSDVEATRLEKTVQDNRRRMLGGLEGPATLATSQRDVIENLVSQDDIDKMRDKVTKINEIIKDGITSEEKTQLADLGVVVTGQGGRRGERRIINLAVQEAVRTRDEMLTANAELNASRDQTANVQNMIAPQINSSSSNQSVVTPIVHHNTEPPAGSSLPMAFR